MSKRNDTQLENGLSVTLVLWASMVLLVAGLYAPLMTIKQLVVFENSVSVITGIEQLYHERDYGLFALILLFSVIFPIAKLLLLAWTWFVVRSNGARDSRLLRFIEFSGKWSMLDVFVAAVIVVAVKLGSVSDVSIHYGIYLFAFAIVGTMITTYRMRRFIHA